MAEHRTADEAAAEYRTAMGTDLGPLFYRLWNDCALLHLQWRDFETLFGTSIERIELLNSAAPSFFHVVQNTAWEQILLQICRLTDPPKSAGKPNLTIQRLPGLVDAAIHAKVKDRVEETLRMCAFARDWRKRHIAHRDLLLALGESPTSLAPASRQAVQDALRSIVPVLGIVEAHYIDATTEFERIPRAGDAEALLHVIRDGLHAEEDRRRKIRAGELDPSHVTGRTAV